MKMKRYAVGLALSFTLLFAAVPAAYAADSAVVSMQEQGDNFVYGRSELVQKLGYQQGFFMRSVHSLWDGSKAVFVNNVNPADGKVSPNTSSDGSVVEFLIMIPRTGGGPANVPVPAEAELSGKGLSALAQDDAGAFWTIKRGTLPERVGTPRAGMSTVYHSSQIVRFTRDGINLTVDTASFNIPNTAHAPYVKDLAYGGGVLYARLETGDASAGKPGGRIAALKPEDGTLLYVLPVDPNTQAVPMKDGRLGLYDGGKLTVYDRAGKEAEQIDLAKKFPFLAAHYVPRFIPEDHGDRYMYQVYGQWYEIDAGFNHVLSQFVYTNTPIRPECPNCPGFDETVPVAGGLRLHIVDQIGYEKLSVTPLKINVYGTPLYTDSPPYLDASAGKVWIPLRAVAEAMNVKVGYDGDSRSVTLQYQDKTIAISQDRPQIEMVTLKEYGATYVSVRQLAELLGQDVSWDAETFTVFIGKNQPLAFTVHPDLLSDRDALLEKLAQMDDFIAKTYTQDELKLLFYEGANVDYKQVLRNFMQADLQKDIENFETISESGGVKWLAVVTKDKRVYKSACRSIPNTAARSGRSLPTENS